MTSSSATKSASLPPSTSASSPYQAYIDRLGALAKSPGPAYAQASLFALVSPFAFAGGRDRARLPDKIPGERAIESLLREAKERRTGASSSASSAGATAAAKAGQAAKAALPVRALPPFWQLAGFGAAFATGGYIIDSGDALNGSGTVTAWSLGYLLFYTGSAIRRPSVFSATLTCATLASLAIHGSHYFSRTSWRGAIPGLANVDASSSR